MNTQFSLTKEDLKSSLRGFGIALLGAVLSYAATNVLPMLEASAITPQAVVLITFLSSLVNVIQRFIRNT